MIAAGVIAFFLAVHAEGEGLEEIATPLTAEEPADRGRLPARAVPATP
jgi:hypothetical protein